MRTFAVEMLRLFAWLVLLLAIFVPVERIWALRPQKVFRKAFGTDLIYFFLSGFIPRLLLTLPLSALAAILHRMIPGGFYAWTAAMPLSVRVLAALVVGDIGSYWGHRWSHQIPFLWRFHAIHHSSEEIDWLVNTRAHPVDLCFVRFCGLVPMYVMGLAQPTGNQFDLAPLLVTLVGTGWGFFIHANVGWRLGWFEWLVSTPAFHHWHHTNDGPELIDKNYAAMLPWVDRMFGTFYLPDRRWPVKYGVDAPMPENFPEQLIYPLDARPG
jgi:sterol desaturase/sphingolipid hydroxylase (fatty acid hydroxylase superfamily)